MLGYCFVCDDDKPEEVAPCSTCKKQLCIFHSFVVNKPEQYCKSCAHKEVVRREQGKRKPLVLLSYKPIQVLTESKSTLSLGSL